MESKNKNVQGDTTLKATLNKVFRVLTFNVLFRFWRDFKPNKEGNRVISDSYVPGEVSVGGGDDVGVGGAHGLRPRRAVAVAEKQASL